MPTKMDGVSTRPDTVHNACEALQAHVLLLRMLSSNRPGACLITDPEGPSTQFARFLVPKNEFSVLCLNQKPHILGTWTFWVHCCNGKTLSKGMTDENLNSNAMQQHGKIHSRCTALAASLLWCGCGAVGLFISLQAARTKTQAMVVLNNTKAIAAQLTYSC